MNRAFIACSAEMAQEKQRFSNRLQDIAFESLDVGNTLTLNVKNGNVSGTVVGSYDDFSIQSDIKKGESNLPDTKDGGGKTLHVSCNNGDVDIAFVSNE